MQLHSDLARLTHVQDDLKQKKKNNSNFTHTDILISTNFPHDSQKNKKNDPAKKNFPIKKQNF